VQNTKLLFRQLFDAKSSTYTYLLADKFSGEAILIDTVKEQVEREITLLKDLELSLKFPLETRLHADHITAAGLLREKVSSKSVVGVGGNVDSYDRLIEDDEELTFGDFSIKAISTPGHTDSCTSYYMDGMVFTGDTLLIRGCGRTDFQQGSPEKLYSSVKKKLFSLPVETLVYPAHNYQGMTCSSISEEKKHNPRLADHISKDEFVKIMTNLKLDPPAQIHVAVPWNMNCGLPPN